MMTQETFLQELNAFINEWHNESSTIIVHTSGSTGTPKAIQVEKIRMMASARQTCKFLGLKEGDTALLCMPLPYIAGKMMVVRSIVAGLKLIPVAPSGHPLASLKETPYFAAMTPMQVYNSLQVQEEKAKLMDINQLIIGGGAIEENLAKELKTFPHSVWSTYGMTETLSHIALRRLNGNDTSEWYKPFDGVHIRLSQDSSLIIKAPSVCPEELITNDIAEINDKGLFRILGRKDNIINSGGIKIQIEQVETLLKKHIDKPFQITSFPDEKFGEIVAMLYEEGEEKLLLSVCQQALPNYWIPKRFMKVTNLPKTETGKPDRATAKMIIKTLDR